MRRIRPLSVSILCATGPYTTLAATLFGENTQQFQPFKGAGAVSSWKQALPRLVARQFDYTSVSDLVLHLRCTDVDGGPMLRSAVTVAFSLVPAQIAHVGARDGPWRSSKQPNLSSLAVKFSVLGAFCETDCRALI
ncbi:hypothetical protein B0T26DRAFT_747044 [Lasiosphaeria miniovina]|uniref:Tc toxin complex TcA C-terminal TcB-binding domain-containing protein n=1 Tax=Lasiosphaeria miniovina TaxID=1954250 RepID=A0AA40EF47_9PEZI|nr:uncharacterized protein B0T26DRAFT_747044 [Lasiosphaeria miniovina]KAK0735231.1 hypothetical protein B0T26DRAFT_747044 [Lasiosphaeria miniovina]